MNQKILLIVDDEPTNISIVAKILHNLYEIKIATDGHTALDIAEKSKPDLILLDINMPGMNGYEVALKLTSSKNTENIPFIFLTAKNDPLSIVEGFKKGAVDYISKPFAKEELLARVETHLKIYDLQNSLKNTVDELANYVELMDENIISSTTDLNGIIKNASSAFCKICGFSKKELISNNHAIIRHDDMPKEVYIDLWETIKKDLVWKGELKNKRKDGSSYWVEATIYPNYDKITNEKIGYTSIRQDITDKKRIEKLSIHDDLTKLYNRRYFNEKLKEELNRSKRDKKTLFFMMLDVDNFKLYNDEYGHQGGDTVLQEISEVLKSYCKRAGDFAFRLGGEEFGLLFSELTKDQAETFANVIKEAIQKLELPHKKNLPSKVVTVSAGLLTILHDKKTNEEDIYKKADDLLYEAKKSGRNKVCTSK